MYQWLYYQAALASATKGDDDVEHDDDKNDNKVDDNGDYDHENADDCINGHIIQELPVIRLFF